MNLGPRSLLFMAALAAIFSGGCEVRSSQPGTAPQESAETGETRDQAVKVASPSVSRGGIEFVAGYHRGYELALEQRKPMLVFFTAEWCTYCHQMEADAFVQEAVVNLSREFVCVLVDADCEPDVCQEFRVKGYPTIQFLSPRGVPLNRVTGKQPSQQLVMQMQAALQAVARRGGGGDSLQR